jgi:hypothetical protein
MTCKGIEYNPISASHGSKIIPSRLQLLNVLLDTGYEICGVWGMTYPLSQDSLAQAWSISYQEYGGKIYTPPSLYCVRFPPVSRCYEYGHAREGAYAWAHTGHDDLASINLLSSSAGSTAPTNGSLLGAS